MKLLAASGGSGESSSFVKRTSPDEHIVQHIRYIRQERGKERGAGDRPERPRLGVSRGRRPGFRSGCHATASLFYRREDETESEIRQEHQASGVLEFQFVSEWPVLRN